MSLIRRWWYARLRKIDMQILWPECVKVAHTLDEAKAAFAYHAFNDPAWTFLGEDEIVSAIDSLTSRIA